MNETELREDWLSSPAELTEDSLLIKGFQVMQRWEDGYMAELASATTRNGGRILEVGFGMGISAGYIQKADEVQSHVIVECHPDVVQFACRKFRRQIASGRVVFINGFWEDVLPYFRINSFDGILFDSIEVDKEPHLFNCFPFFAEAYRLLREGGTFTYFSDEAEELSKEHVEELKRAGFSKIDHTICEVDPPKDCRYWKDSTIVVPIITK